MQASTKIFDEAIFIFSCLFCIYFKEYISQHLRMTAAEMWKWYF